MTDKKQEAQEFPTETPPNQPSASSIWSTEEILARHEEHQRKLKAREIAEKEQLFAVDTNKPQPNQPQTSSVWSKEEILARHEEHQRKLKARETAEKEQSFAVDPKKPQPNQSQTSSVWSKEEILARHEEHRRQVQARESSAKKIFSIYSLPEEQPKKPPTSSIWSNEEIFARHEEHRKKASIREEQARLQEKQRHILTKKIKDSSLPNSFEWTADFCQKIGLGYLSKEDINFIKCNFTQFKSWINPDKSQSIFDFKNEINERKNVQIAIDTVEQHKKILFRKRSQILRIDEYGILTGLEKWQYEIEYFIKNVIPDGVMNWVSFSGLAEYIENVTKELDSSEVGPQDIHTMTGTEFELYCEAQLRKRGLTAMRIGGVGDQGVDLIVEFDGHRFALQCKRYAGTIGNSAVQEVAAGMAYHDCSIGIVVTNSSYSSSAQTLADKLNIHLFHTSEFDKIVELIRGVNIYR